jgi:hypothetical protein
VSAPLRLCGSLLAWAAGAAALAGASATSAQGVGTSTGLRYGMPDKPAMAYVSNCLGSSVPRPTELYARGGWFVTEDLREQIREHAGNLEGVALVWKHTGRGGSYPAAVYQWNHDLEFNRDVVACLDVQGEVSRSESRYSPADTDPKQRWTYIHTLAANPHTHGALHGAGRFLDAQGRPMGRPHLSSEDQDFIAGERVFRQWKDFDFASLVDAQRQ